MKVLVITNDFPPKVGGADYYVAQLTQRFPPGEITVFAADWPGAAEFDAEFPHRVVRWSGRSMYPTTGVVDRAEELVREEGADIVLFGAAAPLGIMGRTIERRTGVPFAACTHGLEVNLGQLPVLRPFLMRMGRHARLFTTVSRWAMGQLRELVGSSPRIELLPPGIDADVFHPEVSDAPVRERYGLGDDPVICCVSRLTPRKGQDRIISALPEILAEVPEVRFLAVGSGADLERLQNMARRKRVRDRVVFTGEVPYRELPAHFRAGDVFAMPCRNRRMGLEAEALGSVFYQAHAVGRPVVAGDSGGAPEAVRNGETGLVVDGNDVDAVGEAILTLLRDPDRREKMGIRGAEWVHRELTWDAMATRLRSLLIDALA